MLAVFVGTSLDHDFRNSPSGRRPCCENRPQTQRTPVYDHHAGHTRQVLRASILCNRFFCRWNAAPCPRNTKSAAPALLNQAAIKLADSAPYYLWQSKSLVSAGRFITNTREEAPLALECPSVVPPEPGRRNRFQEMTRSSCFNSLAARRRGETSEFHCRCETIF